MKNTIDLSGKLAKYLKALKANLPYLLCTILLLSLSVSALANEDEGFTQTTAKIKRYFSLGVDLMLVVGGLVGLIGAIKTYQKWNSGDPDTWKSAAGWFGSCLFLLAVPLILKGFFGM